MYSKCKKVWLLLRFCCYIFVVFALLLSTILSTYEQIRVRIMQNKTAADSFSEDLKSRKFNMLTESGFVLIINFWRVYLFIYFFNRSLSKAWNFIKDQYNIIEHSFQEINKSCTLQLTNLEFEQKEYIRNSELIKKNLLAAKKKFNLQLEELQKVLNYLYNI